jgi:uncharacterized protein YjbI with pentapeptide repeats
MEHTIIESQEFNLLTELQPAIYEDCTFKNCTLNDQSFENYEFVDCHFIDCNLSMSKLNKTAFKNVVFSNCKLYGLHFEDCKPFLLKLKFESCLLNFSTFIQMNLKATIFDNSILEEVDFTQTNLEKASFDNCNMDRAIFENTILVGAKLTNTLHLVLDPKSNNIQGASISLHAIPGLLTDYSINIV